MESVQALSLPVVRLVLYIGLGFSDNILGFSMVPMVLSVDVNCAKLQKRSSSGNAATASTNDSASSSSGGVSLCLSHFDLYFGSVSSKTAKLKQYMKDKTVDKEKW